MNIREKLYRSYINEIKFFNPELRNITTDQIIRNYQDISSFSDLFWFDLYHGPEIVGFILVTNGSHCPAFADYHIMEMYLIPTRRKKGIASKALENLFSNNGGKAAAFILDTNTAALDFWNSFHEKHNTMINRLKAPNDAATGCKTYLWDVEGFKHR